MTVAELQIFDCEQGSEEWYACRRGIPTASEFGTVLASGKKKGEDSKGRRTYMLKLVGERLTGQPMESYSNGHMERGKEMEPQARSLYALMKEVDPIRVGFLRRGDVGASPDSLVETTGLVELKSKLPHLQLEVLEADVVPTEHKAQCQGQLWVSGREWLDFVSYWPGLPLFVKRVQRDEAYIATLAVGVQEFLEELEALTQKFRSMQ